MHYIRYKITCTFDSQMTWILDLISKNKKFDILLFFQKLMNG